MAKYILKRLLLIIPVVIAVCILAFTIMYLAPGDPATIILGATAPEADLIALRDRLGINDPYIIQLGRYLYQVFFEFDFGDSYITGTSIAAELLARLPRTLFLDVVSIAISMIFGIALGINAAVHQNKFADFFSMVIALIGVSMPGFWFALMLVLIFSRYLNILPSHGMGGIEFWIMPIAAAAFQSVASQARQARSSMLEVLSADYIVMAKAKGVSHRNIVLRHALPNAMIPMITVAGMDFGRMLGGALVIETVFSIPGIGQYLVSGINNRDYPVVQGSIIFLAVCFSLIMLVSDLVIAYVDPRIRSQFIERKTRASRRRKNINAET